MTTEQQLREALDAHVEQAPVDGDRIGQVRGRIRARRRRRAAGASLALAVAVAAIAVPVSTRHASTARIQPAGRPSVSFMVSAGAPNPEYTNGSRKLAGAIAASPAGGSLTYTFTPTSYRLFLTTTCTTSTITMTLTVNGHPTLGGGCFPGTTSAGNPADPVASSAEWSRLVRLGRPNTVVMTLVSGITSTLSGAPLSRNQRKPGTFASAMYEAVPVADYPIPARPPTTLPPEPNGPRPVVLDARRVGADGTFTFPVVVGAQTELDVSGVGPGQLTLTIDGHELAIEAFWTYDEDTVADIPLDPGALRQIGITAHNGERLTVAVTASRFSGPYWLIDSSQGG